MTENALQNRIIMYVQNTHASIDKAAEYFNLTLSSTSDYYHSGMARQHRLTDEQYRKVLEEAHIINMQ